MTFFIFGCGDTADEAEADNDRNLKAFLERARERNLRLNADKLKLKMTQVPYIGHLLTREGLRVNPKKVKSIEEMPAPKDAKAVQRLLGSVNYLAKFVPHLSNTMQPLRRLLDKDTEWCWLHTHQQAFDEMKRALTITPALSYYYVMKPVVIQCDVSDSTAAALVLRCFRMGFQSPTRHMRVLASDEPTNHRLRQPVQCVQHISSGALQ